MLPAPNLRSTPTAARLTAGYVLDPGNVSHERAATADDNELLAAERYAALRQVLARPPAAVLPGSARPAGRRPAGALRPDQRPARHPGR
jgi:hypothetical protein